MNQRGLVGWLKNRVTTFIDPDREERTEKLAIRLHKQISELKRDFRLEDAFERLNIEDADRDDVCRKMYCRCVDSAWKDLELTEKEATSLEWLADSLKLSQAVRLQCHREKGRDIFGTLLASSLEDGNLNHTEATRLDACARWMGTTTGSVVREFFMDEGAGFLRSLFLDATQRGTLADQEWRRILQQTSRLGIDSDELAAVLGRHATSAVEHAFANASADGKLSETEEQSIRWMLTALPLERSHQAYIERQLSELRLLTDAAGGRLPSLTPPSGIELRSGEIVHFHGPATWHSERVRRGEQHIEMVPGFAAITDLRLIFSSPTKSFVVQHKSVLETRSHVNGLELRSSSKGTGVYDFDDRNRIACAIYRVAVKRWNQTIVEKSEGLPGRHIPREVRQRVWQLYGGRCAECAAEDYIEFDHIVPVAKGGSNSEKNVQLLCRRCNGKKSDFI